MVYKPLLQLFSVNKRHLKEKDGLDRSLQCSTSWYIKEVKATNRRQPVCMISLYEHFLDIGYYKAKIRSIYGTIVKKLFYDTSHAYSLFDC